MKRKRWFALLGGAVLVVVGFAAGMPMISHFQVQGAVNIYASPIQAGCYIAAANDCRIHVEPFSIDIASGQRLVFFQLIAIQTNTGQQTMIHDFRPDQSNPVPFSGNLFSPSLVTQDYAASCGKSYEISLQGRDSGDVSTFNLGLTGAFTCPSRVP